MNMSASRSAYSLFTELEDLERAASRIPGTAECSRQVANSYLGPPPDLVEAAKPGNPKEIDDENVVHRLRAMTRRIDESVEMINFNLNRMME